MGDSWATRPQNLLLIPNYVDFVSSTHLDLVDGDDDDDIYTIQGITFT